MLKNAAKLEPEHGLIIVDTCVLASIAEHINSEFLINPNDELKNKHWADALGLLARHGFSVKIPEMVAFESGEILADGKSCSAFFTGQSDFSRQRYILTSAAQKSQLAFLNSIIHGEFGDIADIAIEPPDGRDSSPSANFIRSYRKLLTSIEKMQTSGIKNERDRLNQQSDITAMGNLKKRENLSLKDFGDQAAQDIIKRLPKDWSKPVFYLTEDHAAFAAAKAVRPELKICQVNTTAYLQALHDNGILENLGAKLNDKTSEVIAAQMHDQSTQRYNKIRDLFKEANKNTRTKRIDDLVYPLIDSAGGKTTPNDFSFSDAVFAAKESILSEQAMQEHLENVPLTSDQEQQLQTELEQAKQKRLEKFATSNAKSLQSDGVRNHLKSSSANGRGSENCNGRQ